MAKKLTQEEFIKNITKVHGDKYDYSNIEYVSSKAKIRIICHKHGEFMQMPSRLLNGYGCKYCSGPSMTTLDFVEKSKVVHLDKYDYSKVNYINAKTDIIIICKKHGEFIQNSYNHLSGKGCSKCSYKILSNEEFIQKANERHNNKYNYSLTRYIHNKSILNIICPTHGKFEQRADVHLIAKIGCKYCKNDNIKITNLLFIEKAIKIHGNKYDYSIVNYINTNTKVTIMCQIHGEFKITPKSHLSKKQGCSDCTSHNPYINKKNDLYKDFIEKSIIIHGDKYNYSKTIYVSAKYKVTIICPIHGDFKQTINKHKIGRGCPICNESTGEREIRKYLQKNKIKFEPQKKYTDCRNVRELPFDFYLPDYNTCIEYNGIQHYKSINHFGGSTKLKLTQKNDKIKIEYCHNNNIQLITIKYDENILEKLQHLI